MSETSFDRARIQVLLLEGVHASAAETLQAGGYSNVTRIDHALQGAELAAALKDVHMLGIRSRTQLTADIIESAERLMAVGCFCIGTNQVRLDAATRAGIPVFNAPYSNTRSVAELVLAEAILLLRGVPEKTRQMHDGNWQKSARASFEVRGKTLGVIGLGRLGSQVAKIGLAFGMEVVAWSQNLTPDRAREVGVPAVSKDELFARSDVVTVHLVLSDRTRGLVGEPEFAKMKPSAFLINTSRGPIVDTAALMSALRASQIAGAGIDVYDQEPLPADHPLRSCPNALLTPHIGYVTEETYRVFYGQTVDAIAAYLAGEPIRVLT